MTTPASARLRREAHSVHHALCDLRRPPVGPYKCSCKVPGVATALADLLDAIHPRGHGAGYDCDAACLDPIIAARDALEQAITKGQP